jgi:hypothetical protein
MNTDTSRYARWLPALLLLLSWLALWLTGLWLTPARPDEAIAVIRVNDVYLDGRRFTCEHLSETIDFSLGCTLARGAGELRVETRWDLPTSCAASWRGQPLACQLRGFGYFRVVAEVKAPAEVAAVFAPGDVTLVALGVNEQSWLWIGLGVLAATSLLALYAVWVWSRQSPRRILTVGLILAWLLPLNLIIVVANYAGLSMID